MAYRFPDRVVYFAFISNPNCERQLPYTSWNVTSDTLTAIDVTFRPQPLVADTGIDLTKYRKIEAGGDLLGRYGGHQAGTYHRREGSELLRAKDEDEVDSCTA